MAFAAIRSRNDRALADDKGQEMWQSDPDAARGYWDSGGRLKPSPLRWHPEYSQSDQFQRSISMPYVRGGLEPIKEDVSGHHHFQHLHPPSPHFHRDGREPNRSHAETTSFFNRPDSGYNSNSNSSSQNDNSGINNNNKNNNSNERLVPHINKNINYNNNIHRDNLLKPPSRKQRATSRNSSGSPGSSTGGTTPRAASPSSTKGNKNKSDDRHSRTSRTISNDRTPSQSSLASIGSGRKASGDASSNRDGSVVTNNTNKNSTYNNSNNSKDTNNRNENANSRSRESMSESGSTATNRKVNIIGDPRSSEGIVSSVLTASGSGIDRNSSTLTFVGADGNSATLNIPAELLQTTKSRFKKLLSPITMCLIVIALIGALAAAVYFALEFQSSQESQIEFLQATLRFTLAPRDAQSRDFSGLTASERAELERAYCQQVDALISRSNTNQDYRGCEVDRLTNDRIDFKVFFLSTPEAERQANSIIDVLARDGTRNAQSGENVVQISGISVDVSRDTADMEIEKTLKEKDFYGADSHRNSAESTTQADLDSGTTRTQMLDEETIDPPSSAVTPPTQQSSQTNTLRNETGLSPEICASIHPQTHVAHPYDCSHYIQCEFDKPLTRPCNGGLVFDPSTKSCVLPRDDLPCKTITPCDNINGGHFAHPTNCRLYVQCDQGDSVVMPCGDQVWDDTSKTCRPRRRGTECDVAS